MHAPFTFPEPIIALSSAATPKRYPPHPDVQNIPQLNHTNPLHSTHDSPSLLSRLTSPHSKLSTPPHPNFSYTTPKPTQCTAPSTTQHTYSLLLLVQLFLPPSPPTTVPTPSFSPAPSISVVLWWWWVFIAGLSCGSCLGGPLTSTDTYPRFQ